MGYGADDDEDAEDLSGFMGAPPIVERPKVTTRARGGLGSGPESTAGSVKSAPTTANVGYVVPPAPEFETGFLAVVNPLQAHDESFLKPQVSVALKTAGVVGMIGFGVYAAGQKSQGGWFGEVGSGVKKGMGVSVLAYVWPQLGGTKGHWQNISEKDWHKYTAAALSNILLIGPLGKALTERWFFKR